jgi:hypothetical protein
MAFRPSLIFRSLEIPDGHPMHVSIAEDSLEISQRLAEVVEGERVHGDIEATIISPIPTATSSRPRIPAQRP